MAKPKLNVVIPVYNEIEIVDQLHTRVMAACCECDIDFRIIYVDDGSRDGTADWIHQNAVSPFPMTPAVPTAGSNNGAQSQSNVTLIRLSKNFGQPAAILAGIQATDGDCTIVMDGDLQDPPELIPELVEAWQRGSQVVIAKRRSRQESFLRGLAFKTFHKTFRYLSDSPITPNTGTFCLLDRVAVDAISELPESHRFFPGLRAWVGFKQSVILYDRCERAGGEPKQNFVRLLRYALDAIFGFSFKPLRILTGAGMLICALSFTLACWFIFKRMIGWETASVGFTTLTCAVFGLGGFQLIGMGVLGEYIGRIYDEVKARPQFIVAQKQATDDPQASRRPENRIPEQPLRKAG